MQLLHYILKRNYFGMKTVTNTFWSKLLASLMRNYFSKRTSGAPLHTLSKLDDVPVGFYPPLLRQCLLYLRSPKGGCCSISDDLSCSSSSAVKLL